MRRTRFDKQRQAFFSFKERLAEAPDVRSEIETAFSLLLEEYNTTVYENRFVVGGVSEHILGAAFRALGFQAMNTGATNPRIDIQLPDCDGFSVKGVFSEKKGEVRLINSLGVSDKRGWNESTLFVLSGVGVAYADPVLLPSATESRGDALVLKWKPLKELVAEQPAYLIELDIPHKSMDLASTKVASALIAAEILSRPQFKILSSHR
jgi:hypothetical protein